ncbi:MAG: hypothetical protein ACRD3V_29780 [Vicinamibacteria bacterium]
MSDSFFVPLEKAFAATDATRGPWDDRHQHGGPPSGLLGPSGAGLTETVLHDRSGPAGRAVQTLFVAKR